MSRGEKTIERIFALYGEKIESIESEGNEGYPVWFMYSKPGWCFWDGCHSESSPLISDMLKAARDAQPCDCWQCVEVDE